MVKMSHEKYSYYNVKDDLFVFSKASGRLYGFDKLGASIFSFLKEKIGSKEDLLQSVGDNNEVHSLIHIIGNLLEGQEEPEPETVKAFAYEYPPIAYSKYKNPFYYQLNDFIFLIDTESKLIIEKILPALAHLKCELCPQERISLNITFILEKNRWSICLNGKAVRKGLELAELLPRVQDCIRIAYYRSTDYLISLHSAALYFNKIPLILPAASGSGKSTLSTYLMYQKNFEFLTDEVVMIDKNSSIYPIPMAITIKEGSWKVLESFDITLNHLSVHKRFDGQCLRFLPPRQIATENLKIDGAYLIFPRYVADTSTKIESLSTLETLNMITESGYEVFDSFDQTTVEQWINIIERLKKYTITYSNMEEAQQHIERLMST